MTLIVKELNRFGCSVDRERERDRLRAGYNTMGTGLPCLL